MSAEWINVLVQIAIAAANIVVAAANAYLAITTWKSRPSSGDAGTITERKTEHQLEAPEPFVPTEAAIDKDYVSTLVEVVRHGDNAKSKSFEQHPRKVGRASRNSLIGMAATSALSVPISIMFVLLFPSAAVVLTVPLVMITVVASTVVWWRIFSASSNRISRELWAQVEEVENELEKTLTERVGTPRFTPEMALALHDRLLVTTPRVMPPMILISDRVVMGELVRRLRQQQE